MDNPWLLLLLMSFLLLEQLQNINVYTQNGCQFIYEINMSPVTKTSFNELLDSDPQITVNIERTERETSVSLRCLLFVFVNFLFLSYLYFSTAVDMTGCCLSVYLFTWLSTDCLPQPVSYMFQSSLQRVYISA